MPSIVESRKFGAHGCRGIPLTSIFIMHSNTHIHIAGERYEVARGLTQGSALYQVGGTDPHLGYLLLELDDERDIPLAPSDYIVVNGKERFSVARGAYPSDDNPRLRRPLRPVMNEVQISADAQLGRAKCTPGQLSELDPNFEAGDGVFVDLQDIPDAQVTEGIRLLVQADDRFYTSPCGNVGYGQRLNEDLEAARAHYGAIDCFDEGARMVLVFKNQRVADHWNRSSTDILVQVPQGYPMGALDMFWVPPGMRLKDGRMPSNAESIETFLGQQWQRFSWHYPQTCIWNPGTDGVLSHMRFVRRRLAMAS